MTHKYYNVLTLICVTDLVRRCHMKELSGDSAFGAAALRLWNELPVNIRASGTIPMFRKCLKISFY